MTDATQKNYLNLLKTKLMKKYEDTICTYTDIHSQKKRN